MRCLHNHDSLIMCLFSMMVLIQPCPWTLSMITNGLANGKSLLHDNSVPLIFNSNVFFYVHKVRFALWVYQQLTRVMFSYWFLTSSNTLLIIFIISFIIMIMIMASLYSSPGGSAWWKPASCERPRRSPWRPPGWSAGRPQGARPTRGICAPLPRPRRSPRRAPSSRDRPWCWLFSPPWLQDLFSLGEHLHELAARAFRPQSTPCPWLRPARTVSAQAGPSLPLSLSLSRQSAVELSLPSAPSILICPPIDKCLTASLCIWSGCNQTIPQERPARQREWLKLG